MVFFAPTMGLSDFSFLRDYFSAEQLHGESILSLQTRVGTSSPLGIRNMIISAFE